jgi:hypothetical protein
MGYEHREIMYFTLHLRNLQCKREGSLDLMRLTSPASIRLHHAARSMGTESGPHFESFQSIQLSWYNYDLPPSFPPSRSANLFGAPNFSPGTLGPSCSSPASNVGPPYPEILEPSGTGVPCVRNL